MYIFFRIGQHSEEVDNIFILRPYLLPAVYGFFNNNIMQLSTFETLHNWDFTGKKVMIGISGGINSAAVLCYLKKHIEKKPKELHLFYAHFEEHSPNTKEFVKYQFEYAKDHFDNVFTTIQDNSVLQFFRESKMIPHPMVSPCTRILKVMPIQIYMEENDIDVDLVGYVREEDRRVVNQIGRKMGLKKLSRSKLIEINSLLKDLFLVSEKHQKAIKSQLILLGVKDTSIAQTLCDAYFNKMSADGKKAYPIAHITDNDCFSLVRSELRWYPQIYNLRWNDPRIKPFFEDNKDLLIPEQAKAVMNKIGSPERIFKHNNCLPCKNMVSWEFLMIKLFYPEYYINAVKLQKELNASEWEGRMIV